MIHIFAEITSFLSFLSALLFFKWLCLRIGRKPSHGDSAFSLYFAFTIMFFVLGIFQITSPDEFWSWYLNVFLAMFFALFFFAILDIKRLIRKMQSA